MHEYHKRFRPKKWNEFIGNEGAVQSLAKKVEKGTVPHAILFSGPSGTGKTTLARILRTQLNCSGKDFAEINCADYTGVKFIRDIRAKMNLYAWGGKGKCKIYLLDEVHQLSRESQEALLKMLEDTPSHVYFFLATTLPDKLITTIKTRCTPIEVKPLSDKLMQSLLSRVLKTEKIKVHEEVVERIIEVSGGSARRALVLLEKIVDIEGKEDQLNEILSSDTKRQGIDIARALMKPNTKWNEIAAMLRAVEEEPEGIRRIILAYFTKVLLGGGKLAARASLVIGCFELDFYASGKAGLANACYTALTSKD